MDGVFRETNQIAVGDNVDGSKCRAVECEDSLRFVVECLMVKLSDDEIAELFFNLAAAMDYSRLEASKVIDEILKQTDSKDVCAESGITNGVSRLSTKNSHNSFRKVAMRRFHLLLGFFGLMGKDELRCDVVKRIFGSRFLVSWMAGVALDVDSRYSRQLLACIRQFEWSTPVLMEFVKRFDLSERAVLKRDVENGPTLIAGINKDDAVPCQILALSNQPGSPHPVKEKVAESGGLSELPQNRKPKRRPPPRKPSPLNTESKAKFDPILRKFSGTYVVIAINKVKKGETIWSKVKLNGVEDFFEEKDFDTFLRARDAPRAFSASRISLVSEKPVFQRKRDDAISIAMARMKRDDLDLRGAILDMKLDNFNLVNTLIQYFPTESELRDLEKRGKGVGRAEKFFFACLDCIGDLKRGLTVMKFRALVGSLYVCNGMSELTSFYDTILNSANLLKLFSGCLFVIVIFNKCSIEGFPFNDIETLSRSKGKDGRSLLSLVIRKLRLFKLSEELRDVDLVRQISLDRISEEIKEMDERYAELSSDFNSNGHGSVSSVQKDAIDFAIEKYRNLKKSFNDLEQKRTDLEKYIGCKVDDGFYTALSVIRVEAKNASTSEGKAIAVQYDNKTGLAAR